MPKIEHEELVQRLEGMPLHERLALLRSMRGLSQEKLAKTLGVSRPTISTWEQPPLKETHYYPSKMNRNKLAIHFGVPAKCFTNEWGESVSPPPKKEEPKPEGKREVSDPPRNLRRGPFNPAAIAAERRGEETVREREPIPGVKRIG